MIILLRIGNAERNDHAVNKARIRHLYALLREIVAGSKHQFVLPWLHFLTLQQRGVTTAVVVRHDALEQCTALPLDRIQLDFHTGTRLALRYVQYMRAEFSHGFS